MLPKAVVWLIRDGCRVADNPTAVEAVRWAQRFDAQVVPLACLEPRRWLDQQFGLPRVGPAWMRFRVESLLDLKAALNTQGSDLWLAGDSPDRALDGISSVYSILGVVTDHPVSTEERIENAQIVAEGYALRAIESDDLFRHAQLPFELDELPESFTRFRKAIEKAPAIRPDQPLPSVSLAQLPPAPWGAPGEWIEAMDAIQSQPAARHQGGRDAGLRHWQQYLASGALSTYKETRNAFEGVHVWSGMSPWLAHGCVSARELWVDTLAYEADHGANESTYWLRFELLWREYFRWYARAMDWTLFRRRGPAGRDVNGDFNRDRFARWSQGATGCDIVDAAMRELSQTGWICNRARQLVASHAIYESGLDWRLGAAWFEATLVDHDVASNWGNWAYIAGVGADPRGGRIFNLDTQAQRYDSDSCYRDRWLP